MHNLWQESCSACGERTALPHCPHSLAVWLGRADGQPLITDANSTQAQTLWALVRGLSEAVLVWYNISGNLDCIDVHLRDEEGDPVAGSVAPPATQPLATPPPACTARDKISSWEPIICNEHWNQVICAWAFIHVSSSFTPFEWHPCAPSLSLLCGYVRELLSTGSDITRCVAPRALDHTLCCAPRVNVLRPAR